MSHRSFTLTLRHAGDALVVNVTIHDDPSQLPTLTFVGHPENNEDWIADVNVDGWTKGSDCQIIVNETKMPG